VKFPKKELSRDSSKDEFFPTPRQRIVLDVLFTNTMKEHFIKALEVEYEVGRERGFEEARKLMLAKIESMLRIARDYQKTTNNQGEALAEIQTLEELEGELK